MNIIQKVKNTPLEIKILFLIVICLVTGFGSYVMYSLHSESRALLDQHRQKSKLFAKTMISGIRNIMLSGRAPYVKSFISEARTEFGEIGNIYLFNNKAEEIFPAVNPFISIPAREEQITAALEHSRFESNLYPIVNKPACYSCHSDNHKLRGLIQLDFQKKTDWESALTQVTTHAFESIMLSGKGEFADTLVSDLHKLPGIRLAQIYDEDGAYVAFGDDDVEIDEDLLEKYINIFQNNPGSPSVSFKENGLKYHFTPLPNREHCFVCHGSDPGIRGLFMLETEESAIEKKTVTGAILSGFGSLMQLQKASYTGAYVEMIRELPFVNSLRIFDNGTGKTGQVNEIYVPNPDYDILVKDESVDSLILDLNESFPDSIIEKEYIEEISGVEFLTQVIPIMNDVKCQACHSQPKESSPAYVTQMNRWKTRSVVKISASMYTIQEEIKKNTTISIIIGIITMGLVAMMLRIFMRMTVLQPLDIIGAVADKVKEGDLSVNAAVQSGDEIGILAKRINDMIQGLRERMHLTKFVSDDTLSAVQKADLKGVELGGKRKEATVLFSDIRGFTSYSETVDPEDVIDMLNTYLNRQAEIVKEFDGDIDKFVGDELMAIFIGDDMAKNAVNCSVAIQKAMTEINQKAGGNIGVGIGINTGLMVMGAMGSKDRMDYTVIGDNVNLGARLCSAAKAGEIILAKSVTVLLDKKNYQLKKMEPINVK